MGFSHAVIICKLLPSTDSIWNHLQIRQVGQQLFDLQSLSMQFQLCKTVSTLCTAMYLHLKTGIAQCLKQYEQV